MRCRKPWEREIDEKLKKLLTKVKVIDIIITIYNKRRRTMFAKEQSLKATLQMVAGWLEMVLWMMSQTGLICHTQT